MQLKLQAAKQQDRTTSTWRLFQLDCKEYKTLRPSTIHMSVSEIYLPENRRSKINSKYHMMKNSKKDPVNHHQKRATDSVAIKQKLK